MNHLIECGETHYEKRTFRPDTVGILIHGRRGRILSTLYTAAGAGTHPVVLLFHGIPGCEQNLDLAQALRRAGFHVMTFHYSGSWGSDGAYSLTNNLEDANTVLDFILQDETYGFDKRQIYAVGHSMGGFVCGQLSARRAEIRRAALLMPCDIGRLPQIVQEDPAAGRAIREVLDDSAGWLVGTSGDWSTARTSGWRTQRRLLQRSRFSASAGRWTSTRRLPCTANRWHGRYRRRTASCSNSSAARPTTSFPTTGSRCLKRCRRF